MKLRLLFVTALMAGMANLGVYSQCVLTGLNTNYCASDDPDTLTATCSGSPADVFGTGVNSQGVFDPSSAGPGTHVITVIGDPNNYNVDVTGTFAPVVGTGTAVALLDDDVAENLPIGFSFRFFDNSYTTFGISSNGFMYFGSQVNGCCTGQAIPTAGTPNNYIAFAWEDLDPDGAGTIEYYTVGTAPNRRLILDIESVPHYPGPGPNNNITTQIQLWEGCGQIEIHTTTQPEGVDVHTMGIENSTGTIGFAAPGRNASTWTATNDYVAFVPAECYTETVDVFDGPALTFTPDTVDCASDVNGSVSVAPVGAAPFTYAWDGGQTVATISSLAPGTYTVTVTGNDGCASSGDVTVVAPLPIGASISETNANCESGTDGTVASMVTGGVTPYSYLWGDPGSSTTDSISGVGPGIYGLTITDAAGCEFVTSSTVGFDNPDPVVDLGEDKGFCPGQSSVLVGPPGQASYNWSNGDSLLSTIVNTAGIYSLTVTSAAGCTGADDITITVFTPAQVDLGSNQSGPISIMLDAGSSFSNFLWNTGANTQTLNVTISGDYSVIVTDSNGCKSSDTVKVSIWTTGLQDIATDELSLYPNPTDGQVFIRTNASITNATIALFDLSGREVSMIQSDLQPGQDLPVDLTGMAAGTYFVRVTSEGAVHDFKITLK